MPLTGFMQAVSLRDYKAVKEALEDKATCEANPSAVIIAAERGDVHLLELLLGEDNEYFDVNYKDERGNTPLVVAIRMGYPSVVYYLSQHPHIDLFLESPRGLTPFSVALLTGLHHEYQYENLFSLLNTLQITRSHLEDIFSIISVPGVCDDFISTLLKDLNERDFDDDFMPRLELLQHDSVRCIVEHVSQLELKEKFNQAVQSMVPVSYMVEDPLSVNPVERIAQSTARPYADATDKHPFIIAEGLMYASAHKLQSFFVAFSNDYQKLSQENKIKIMKAIAKKAASEEANQAVYAELCISLIEPDYDDIDIVIQVLPPPYRARIFEKILSKISNSKIMSLLQYEDVRAVWLSQSEDVRLSIHHEEFCRQQNDVTSYQALWPTLSPEAQRKDLEIAVESGHVRMTRYLSERVFTNRESSEYKRWIENALRVSINHNNVPLVEELCCVERYGEVKIGSFSSKNEWVTQVLLKYGANITAKSTKALGPDDLPLIALCIDSGLIQEKWRTSRHGKILSLAIAKGLSSIHDVDQILQLLSYKEMRGELIFSIAQLLTCGFDVNRANVFGIRLLHVVMAFSTRLRQYQVGQRIAPDEVSLAKFLIHCGADVNASCIDGATPYTLAWWTGNEKAIALMASQPAAPSCDYSDYLRDKNDSALIQWQRACHQGKVFFIHENWTHLQETERKYALLYVVTSEVIRDETFRLKLVKALLAFGVTDDSPDPVVTNGKTMVLLLDNWDQALKLKYRDYSKRKYDHYYMLPLSNHRDAELNKSLQQLIKFDSFTCSAYLLDALIFGRNALHAAVQRNLIEVVTALLESSSSLASINVSRYFMESPRYADEMSRWEDRNATALYLAIDNGNLEMVHLLIAKGAIINKPDLVHALIKSEVIAHFLLECLDKNPDKKSREEIINYGKKVGELCYRAVSAAAAFSHFAMVEKLLARGACYSEATLSCAFLRKGNLVCDKNDIIILLLCFMTKVELLADSAYRQVLYFDWRHHLLSHYTPRNSAEGRPVEFNEDEVHCNALVKQALIATQTPGTAMFALAKSSCPRSTGIAIAMDTMRAELLEGFRAPVLPKKSRFWFFGNSGGASAEIAEEAVPATVKSFRKEMESFSGSDKCAFLLMSLEEPITKNDMPLLEEIVRGIGIYQMGVTRDYRNKLITIIKDKEWMDTETALNAEVEALEQVIRAHELHDEALEKRASECQAIKEALGKALLYAVTLRGDRYNMVELLLRYKATVDYKQEEDGMTAVRLAAKAGYTRIARLLIANGANVYVDDSHDRIFPEIVAMESTVGVEGAAALLADVITTTPSTVLAKKGLN